MDERIKTLAYNLVHFSCKLEKGDKLSGTGAASGRNRGTAENHGRGGLPPDGADGCLHRRAWRGQPDRAV